MSNRSVELPYPLFFDSDGAPLENGYIYIGTKDLTPQTNPITVYWDKDNLYPASQPIRTIAGAPSRNGAPGRLYVTADYSILVQDKNKKLVYSSLEATEKIPSSSVTFNVGLTGSVDRDAEDKLQEFVSVKDFGAKGDGVTDDQPAIQLAFDSGVKRIYFPRGTYLVKKPIQMAQHSHAYGDGIENTIIKADPASTANFDFFDYTTTTPVVTAGIFCYAGKFEQLPNLVDDMEKGQHFMDFTTSHGLSDGDIVFVYKHLYKMGVKMGAASPSFQVGETITGDFQSATGTVVAVEETVVGSDTFARITYSQSHDPGGPDPAALFRPYNSTSGHASETVTGATSSATATTYCAGGVFNMARYYYQESECFTVSDSPASDRVDVYGGAARFYDKDQCEVWKFSNPTAGSIKQMTIQGVGSGSIYPYGAQIVGGSNFQVEDCQFKDFQEACLELVNSYRCRVVNTRCIQNVTIGLGGNSGIALGGCQETLVMGCHLEAARHAITSGTYTWQLYKPNLQNMRNTYNGNYLSSSDEIFSADAHGDAFYHYIVNNLIRGGFVLSGKKSFIINNRFEGNGEETWETTEAIRGSEMCGTSHYIAFNTVETFCNKGLQDNGVFHLGVGRTNYLGMVENDGPLIVKDNYCRIEGGPFKADYQAPFCRAADVSNVDWSGTLTVILINNIVETDDGIFFRPWDPANRKPVDKLVMTGNRLIHAPVRVEAGEVNHVVFTDNYVDHTVDVGHDSATVWIDPIKSLECRGNTIQNSYYGAFLIHIDDDIEGPVIVSDNIIHRYNAGGYTSGDTQANTGISIALTGVSAAGDPINAIVHNNQFLNAGIDGGAQAARAYMLFSNEAGGTGDGASRVTTQNFDVDLKGNQAWFDGSGFTNWGNDIQVDATALSAYDPGPPPVETKRNPRFPNNHNLISEYGTMLVEITNTGASPELGTITYAGRYLSTGVPLVIGSIVQVIQDPSTRITTEALSLEIYNTDETSAAVVVHNADDAAFGFEGDVEVGYIVLGVDLDGTKQV